MALLTLTLTTSARVQAGALANLSLRVVPIGTGCILALLNRVRHTSLILSMPPKPVAHFDLGKAVLLLRHV